jgi:hypothetical protein
LHQDFHISRLKLYPEEADGDAAMDDDYFLVESIQDRRRVADGSFEYLVRWVGFGQKHDSWEPIENLNVAAVDDVEEFNKANPLTARGGEPEDAAAVPDDVASGAPAVPVGAADRVDGGGTRLAREARAAAQAAAAEDAVARDAATALRMQRQAKREADKRAREAA